jgi:T5orf172 domain.
MLESNDSIFDFSNSPIIRHDEKAKADFIAKQEPCLEFDDKYAALFRKVQNAIDTGHRKILPFTGGQPKQGDFVVVGGIIVFVAWIDALQQRTKQKGVDARTLCILSNGKQSRLFIQSLVKAMYENDGKIITVDDREDALAAFKESAQNGSDIETGYIYVLRTLSDDEEIKPMANKMYKIGYTSGSVEQRISNAKREATYLCAPVQIVEKIKCLNLNSQKLEEIIHKFFAAVQVPVQVNMNGTPVIATEWYSVPLSVIEKVAELIISGDIVHYRYEPAIYDVVRL